MCKNLFFQVKGLWKIKELQRDLPLQFFVLVIVMSADFTYHTSFEIDIDL